MTKPSYADAMRAQTSKDPTISRSYSYSTNNRWVETVSSTVSSEPFREWWVSMELDGRFFGMPIDKPFETDDIMLEVFSNIRQLDLVDFPEFIGDITDYQIIREGEDFFCTGKVELSEEEFDDDARIVDIVLRCYLKENRIPSCSNVTRHF